MIIVIRIKRWDSALGLIIDLKWLAFMTENQELTG